MEVLQHDSGQPSPHQGFFHGMFQGDKDRARRLDREGYTRHVASAVAEAAALVSAIGHILGPVSAPTTIDMTGSRIQLRLSRPVPTTSAQCVEAIRELHVQVCVVHSQQMLR